MALIDVQGLRKSFRSRAYPQGLLALDEISFSVQEGEFVCLLGPSGCGKSTVLNVLAGLDPDFGGEVRMAGLPLAGDGRQPVRVGYVFQQPRLLPWLTVRGNIYFALDSAAVPREEWAQRTEAWLESVGLGSFADAYPHELSGGMQQRASIARAFAVDPQVLLMDEPFSGLDELTARTMREEILNLWRASGKTVLFVTHNCFEACFLADRILVLTPRPGRLRAELRIPFARPRNYEDTRLFEESTRVTRLITERAASLG